MDDSASADAEGTDEKDEAKTLDEVDKADVDVAELEDWMTVKV